MYYKNKEKCLNIKPGETGIIFDLEATCQVDNKDFDMETIEIGAVAVGEGLVVKGSFDIFIKPVINPVLSEFCTELTHIKQSVVDNAQSFDAAYDIFFDWLNNLKTNSNLIFYSWGDYDKKQLEKDCRRNGFNSPWEIYPHINLKKALCKHLNIKTKGVGRMLKILGLDFEGVPHSGIADAKNIHRIWQHVILKDTYFKQ